jgi:hypothetical protein
MAALNDSVVIIWKRVEGDDSLWGRGVLFLTSMPPGLIVRSLFCCEIMGVLRTEVRLVHRPRLLQNEALFFLSLLLLFKFSLRCLLRLQQYSLGSRCLR